MARVRRVHRFWTEEKCHSTMSGVAWAERVVRRWVRDWVTVMSRLFTEEKSRTRARSGGRSSSFSEESVVVESHQRRVWEVSTVGLGKGSLEAYRGVVVFFFGGPRSVSNNVCLQILNVVRAVGVVQTLREPVDNHPRVDLVHFHTRIRSVPPIQRNVNLPWPGTKTAVHHPQVLLRRVITPTVPAPLVARGPDFMYLYGPHETAPRP